MSLEHYNPYVFLWNMILHTTFIYRYIDLIHPSNCQTEIITELKCLLLKDAIRHG